MSTLPEDVESLQRRLMVSEEWNMRLQTQIQELLRLPRSEVESLRSRMHNPDIAIPLLQCYDAAILEKQEENEKLQQENIKLKTKMDAITIELGESYKTIQSSELLLKETRTQAELERSRIEEAKLESEREAAQTRHELTRALDAESALKRELDQMKRRYESIQDDISQLQQDKSLLEEAAKQTEGRLKVISSEKGERQQQGEVQKIQLQLLSKENEDKMQELERLRHRMVQALRQASENHATHLKVVEEKHREVIEGLRTQLNTKELEVLKLRAQLARVDTSDKNSKYGIPMRTTTEILEKQTLQAQEIELKRLYAEVSSLQLQRDDAMLRYEQLSNNIRKEENERINEAQRELQTLRQKLRTQEREFNNLDKEHSRVKEELRILRDKYKANTGEIQRARQEREQSLRRLEELRRAKNIAEEASENAKREVKEEISQERQRTHELEQRVEEILKEVQTSRDRANAATEIVEKQREELRQKHTEAQEKITTLQTRLATREREVKVLAAKITHLQEAVRMNQQQAIESNERVRQLITQDEEKTRQLREMTLIIEKLKMETARVARARDRLIDDASGRFI